MADTRRDATNTWFQRTNHLRLKREELNMRVIFDAAVTRAAGFGKTIANTARGVAQWSPVDLFPGPNSGQGLVLDFSDISTLYTDEKFRTNISAIGDPVGGVLDKSQGLVLGGEEVINGDFSSSTNWALTADVAITGGSLVFTSAASFNAASQSLSGVAVGDFVEVSYDIVITSGAVSVSLGNFAEGQHSVSGHRVFRGVVTVHNSLRLEARNGPASFTVDNVSVRKLPGNHLIQSTAAARPIWTRHPKSGVRNLVDSSSNPKVFLADGSANAVAWGTPDELGHDGNLSAYVLVDNASGGSSDAVWRRKTNHTFAAAGSYVFGAFVKKRGASVVQLITQAYTGAQGNSYFDLENGTVGALGDGHTAHGILSAGNGFYYCWVSFTLAADLVGNLYAAPAESAFGGRTDGAVMDVVTLDGTSSIIVGALQLEEGSTATAYQTRVSKYNVTEAGVDDCYGLTFDGVDDYLVTAANLDLSGTSEVTLTAGGYKTTDAAGNKTLAVLGAIANGSGRFAMESPPDAGQYAFNAFYASNRTAKVTSGYAAPLNAVATGQASLSSVSLRLDGTQVAADATPNTGGFSSELFNIGRRGNNTSWYAGTIYGVTLTDYILDAEQLAALETWTAARTPEVTLA